MDKPKVALFVTCLVDLFRPRIGFAAVKLLEDAGCVVEVPPSQTCCGQPAFNSGDRVTARAIAMQVIEAFEGYDFVVVPSGSCGAQIAKDYPDLFEPGGTWRERAEKLAAKTHEIVAFLTGVRGVTGVSAKLDATATYHDGCSGLRSLGIKEQPRALLASVEGLSLREMNEAEVCCGFGGTFAVKYPDISNVMAADKVRNAAATEAELLLAGDLGCLLNMAGKASREGRKIRARHVIEVLAGMADGPAIGEGKP